MDGLGQISGGALFKPEKETSFTWRALVTTGAIFASGFVIYFGLIWGYQPLLRGAISKAEDEINRISSARARDEESKQFESRFLDFYSQATNTKKLLENHVSITPVFDLIEKSTRGDVFYQSIQVDRETAVISFSGRAKDYVSLSSQLAVYEGLPQAVGTTITGSRQSDEGMVFDFKLTLKPEVFKFVPLSLEELPENSVDIREGGD